MNVVAGQGRLSEFDSCVVAASREKVKRQNGEVLDGQRPCRGNDRDRDGKPDTEQELQYA